MTRRRQAIAALAVGAVCAGCETTGDPRQGGLFGWSETKAKARQEERRERIGSAQSELDGQSRQGSALESHDAAIGQKLSAAERQHADAEARLRDEQQTLNEKLDRLESASVTPAQASRVRSYRLKANTIAAQTAWTTVQRQAKLQRLERDVDAALAPADR